MDGESMDDETVVVLAVQLAALTCIAGSLLLYLLCKIRGGRRLEYDAEFTSLNVGTGRSVLVTSAESAFGLQLVLHLSALGFRVFAGFRAGESGAAGATADGYHAEADCEAARVLRAKMKARQALVEARVAGVEESGVVRGSIVTLPLDVNREDVLHEAVGIIRRHLPAGEDGLWGVINTAGLCIKGKLEVQDLTQWDAMLKTNVIGLLRCARTFMPLLRTKKGRLLTIGTGMEMGSGCVAYCAARHAVVGASAALAQELHPHGIHVITLQPDTIPSEKLFAKPKICTSSSETSSSERYLKCNVEVVPATAMQTIEEALLTVSPKTLYHLASPSPLSNYIAAITDRFTHAHDKKVVAASTHI
ncbi:D-beta-hydroxybutyrate dehydrogenase, mitochondrial [Nilaparvata lugens]|uniref:D-beta-hydroxybutyrate dehydrogenase, mitochondrial n=1 Tax=Nilaparvata lugens TaxID=108931 RepID=UPI00193CFD86|nr:D-beta-hydroxybutyrate dehydrogenase, mitochondrial [Nilaparvata lugens]